MSGKTDHEITESNDRKHFLTKESFDLLIDAERRIAEVTDLRPSFRKMVNVLVNPDAVDKLVERFIKQLS